MKIPSKIMIISIFTTVKFNQVGCTDACQSLSPIPLFSKNTVLSSHTNVTHDDAIWFAAFLQEMFNEALTVIGLLKKDDK